MRTRPIFYYQKIVSKNGLLVGIELLARNFPVSPETDVHIFFSAVEEILDWNFPLSIHINVFPSTVRYVPWAELKGELGDKLVIEIVENNGAGDFPFRFLEHPFSEGIRVALDDFGAGFSNFQLLRDFPFEIVKIDTAFTSPAVAVALKEDYGVPVVIAEKTCSYPADAFQSFAIHRPEPLTEEARIALSEEVFSAKTQGIQE